MFRPIIKQKFSRNFYTYRQTIKQLLNNKNENLNKKIEKNIFITQSENIYDCANLIKKYNITLVPIVNNLQDKQLISSLHKREIDNYLQLQEYHDYEDFKNWNHIKGNH
jgi:Mg/Co/Ni transporter MgtE